MEKLAIWGNTIPGNSPRSKTEVMELRRWGPSIALVDTLRWLFTVKAGPFKDGKKIIDTYTHKWVPAKDPDYRQTFEDVPYLIPFAAPGSKKAVIVVPGGGYCQKDMDQEGPAVAQRLQKEGITAWLKSL